MHAAGFKLVVVKFANGEPVDSATSNTSATDIFMNRDTSTCPDDCFRPVGIAFDNQGRLFMSSDDSGEIYIVVSDGSVIVGGNQTGNATGGTGGSGGGSTGGGGTSEGNSTDGQSSARSIGNGGEYLPTAVLLFALFALL